MKPPLPPALTPFLENPIEGTANTLSLVHSPVEYFTADTGWWLSLTNGSYFSKKTQTQGLLLPGCRPRDSGVHRLCSHLERNLASAGDPATRTVRKADHRQVTCRHPPHTGSEAGLRPTPRPARFRVPGKESRIQMAPTPASGSHFPPVPVRGEKAGVLVPDHCSEREGPQEYLALGPPGRVAPLAPGPQVVLGLGALRGGGALEPSPPQPGSKLGS